MKKMGSGRFEKVYPESLAKEVREEKERNPSITIRDLCRQFNIKSTRTVFQMLGGNKTKKLGKIGTVLGALIKELDAKVETQSGLWPFEILGLVCYLLEKQSVHFDDLTSMCPGNVLQFAAECGLLKKEDEDLIVLAPQNAWHFEDDIIEYRDQEEEEQKEEAATAVNL